MLEFATLFLGLIWGAQPLELVVGSPELTRVEIRLDGRPVKKLQGPPWKTTVDFGLLAPHRLEAVGFDAQSQPIARAEQWVNMPKPPAEARLVIEQEPGGQRKKAVLKWESIDGSQPQVTVRFDGQILPVTSAEQFDVPVTDPGELHFLIAELIFQDGSTAHAEASFGGQFGDQVETELTAFPVRQLRADAPTSSLSRCLTNSSGEPLKVALVERGAAEVLIVRDAGTEPILRRLRSTTSRLSVPSLRASRVRPKYNMDTARYDMALEDADRVRFIWPNVVGTDHPHFKNAGFFDSSPFVTAKDGGLYFFITQAYPPKTEGPQHLADALALAGLRAAAEGRRRAAILVLGDREPQEKSAQTPAAVRAFLDTLQVPLHVWAGANLDLVARGWPLARGFASVDLMRLAVLELQRDLDSQRVAWIAGRYLPSEIRLLPEGCPDFAPVTTPPPKTARN